MSDESSAAKENLDLPRCDALLKASIDVTDLKGVTGCIGWDGIEDDGWKEGARLLVEELDCNGLILVKLFPIWEGTNVGVGSGAFAIGAQLVPRPGLNLPNPKNDNPGRFKS